MKKRLLLTVTVILAVILSVCAFAISASAESDSEPSVSVEKFNLVFEDNVYLKYAVKYNGVDESDIKADNIGMLYFSEPKGEYIKGNEDFSSSVVGYTTIDEEKYYTFEYRHITAKQMTDYVYCVAYIDVDGVTYYSAPVKYSVLEYAYSKLGKTGEASESEEYKAMLVSMLEFGAKAQDYFNYNENRPANGEYYQISVVGGVLDDGFTSGLYLATDEVTLTANEPEDGMAFSKWVNGVGESVSVDSAFTVTEISANETYTAVYITELKPSEGLAFTSNGDGTCYVSGIGSCADTDIVIPKESPNGDLVISIGSSAFKNRAGIMSVTIPDGVISIGDYAFSWCNNLADISIPNSVNNIDGNAFYSSPMLVYNVYESGKYLGNDSNPYHALIDVTDKNLQSFIIHESTKVLSNRVFSNCSALTNITIPNGITNICNLAFAHCSGLTSITIPASVTNIGSSVFQYCSALKSITIEAIDITIGDYTFNGCSIENATLPTTAMAYIPKGNLKSVVINGGTSIGDYAFYDSPSIESVIINNGVTSIGESAFFLCTGLTSVTIPNSITDIGTSAFQYCSALTAINYTGSEEEWNSITKGANWDANTGNYTITYNYTE